MNEQPELIGELIENAWTIIANANEGDWDRATPEWKEAAERWRDTYHQYLGELPDETKQEMKSWESEVPLDQ